MPNIKIGKKCMSEKLSKALCYKVAKRITEIYCLYYKEWVCICDPKYTPVPWNWIHKNYDIKTIMKHVSGNYAVAIFAGKNATKVVSTDIDDGSIETVRKVIDTYAEIGIPRDRMYVSLSGKKGYHVDFFIDKSIYNNHAMIIYEEMITRSGLDRHKVEFRPTHTQAIKLPLGVHPTTKNRCWFVDQDTFEPIESFEYIYEIKAIDHDLVTGIAKGLEKEYIPKLYGDVNAHKNKVLKPMSGNYGSLVVTAPGTRHNLQAKVAARARMDGCDYDEIVERQMKWYREQNQALIKSSESEVRAEAEQLAKWAVENVAVRASQGYGSENLAIIIRKEHLPYIVGAPTKATRMVLFLLCIYCEKYGEAKISHRTIAEHTGVSVESVKNALKWACDNGYVSSESCTTQYNKFVRLKGANKYKIPGEKKLYAPRKMHLRSDQYVVREWPEAANMYGMYIDMLTSMCTIGYLEKFLTKPELKDCKERMGLNAGQGAGDDAGGSA